MVKRGSLSSNPRSQLFRRDGVSAEIFATRFPINGDLPAATNPQQGPITTAANFVVGPLIEGEAYWFIFSDATAPATALPQAVVFQASALAAIGAMSLTTSALWPCNAAGKQVLLDRPVRIADGEPYYHFRAVGTDVRVTVQRIL